ncbi:MAG: hypothetical protein IIB07_01880 [Bacteroidetes bacterium]|nr:hypothetical protein [Bacteroidota bacterium]MCH8942788.1 hypothetical protein [Bacteroidota bacterium]
MKRFLLILFILGFQIVFFADTILCQSKSVQIYVIDSYIAPEKPLKLNVSFFTTQTTTSKILISNKFEYTISDKLTSLHKVKIDISNFGLKDTILTFKIIVKSSNYVITESQTYLVDYPKIISVGKESNFLLFGMLFASIFIIPTPSYAFTEDGNHFSITKEIPLISFRSESINFPRSYFALEYTHIYNTDRSNFLRIGYKYIKEIPVVKFISPGIDIVTNFDGFNGIGVGVSLGLFNVVDTFTLYVRYRYNFQQSHSERNFSEISLGLYTNFFSVHF